MSEKTRHSLSERLSERKRKRKERKKKEKEHGVKLPFLQLFFSMFTVMIAGLLPCSILVWLFIIVLSATGGFGTLYSVIWIAITPAIIWGLYFLYLLITILVTKIFMIYYDFRSPPQQGKFNRQFLDKSIPDYKVLHYYHLRGAIVKYSIWITQKSPFPSIMHWAFNFYDHNKIGKNIIYENCFPGYELTDIGDGSVLSPGSCLSSHVVESIYGTLHVEQITLGKNAKVGYNSIVGPGIDIGQEYIMGDNCMTYAPWPFTRNEEYKGNYFVGLPAKHRDVDELFADEEMKKQYLDFISS